MLAHRVRDWLVEQIEDHATIILDISGISAFAGGLSYLSRKRCVSSQVYHIHICIGARRRFSNLVGKAPNAGAHMCVCACVLRTHTR